MDPRWTEDLRRLGMASAAAERDRLRRLTIEEALQEFEQLCREADEAFEMPRLPRSHPIGLIKLLRAS